MKKLTVIPNMRDAFTAIVTDNGTELFRGRYKENPTETMLNLVDEFGIDAFRLETDKSALARRDSFHEPFKVFSEFEQAYCQDKRLLGIREYDLMTNVTVCPDAEHNYTSITLSNADNMSETVTMRTWSDADKVINDIAAIPRINRTLPKEELLGGSFLSTESIPDILSHLSIVSGKEHYVHADKEPDMKMDITVNEGLNYDGFSVDVTDNGSTVFAAAYAYGYDVSYQKDRATKKQPYVTDKLQELCARYEVAGVSVGAGRNVFKGRAVESEKVDDFKKTYLSGLPGQGGYLSFTEDDLPDVAEKDISL